MMAIVMTHKCPNSNMHRSGEGCGVEGGGAAQPKKEGKGKGKQYVFQGPLRTRPEAWNDSKNSRKRQRSYIVTRNA